MITKLSLTCKNENVPTARTDCTVKQRLRLDKPRTPHMSMHMSVHMSLRMSIYTHVYTHGPCADMSVQHVDSSVGLSFLRTPPYHWPIGTQLDTLFLVVQPQWHCLVHSCLYTSRHKSIAPTLTLFAAPHLHTTPSPTCFAIDDGAAQHRQPAPS